jgi:uncharacterized protein (TIGR02001 family)
VVDSDYLFRGISQTGGDPPFRVVDYTHSGFYLGTWASNVGWIEDFQGYDPQRKCLYGFRGNVGSSDFVRRGCNQYYYPGTNRMG